MAYEIDDNMTAEEAAYLNQKLIEFADRHAAPRNYREFGFVVRSDSGEVVGGLRANTVWDCLQIEALWVSDELRGQGYGHKLLLQAEEQAREMGCRRARLNTFDFEARTFYEKHGYAVVFETKDLPKGHSQFRLTKDL